MIAASPAVGPNARERLQPMRTTTRLRQMLNAPGIIVAPGAYDGLSAPPTAGAASGFSARLVGGGGFGAVYMAGAGTAASHLGQPDLGLATLTEIANHAGHPASCRPLPGGRHGAPGAPD